MPDPALGEARGYTWPPAEPENFLALKHGAYSTRLVEPRALEIAQEMADEAMVPGYLQSPEYRPALLSYCRTLAQVERVRSWLASTASAGALYDPGARDRCSVAAPAPAGPAPISANRGRSIRHPRFMEVEPLESKIQRFEPSSLPEAIGAVVMVTSGLEFQLTHVVTGLTQSPLTLICVRGMRGSSLVEMARRLLKHGVGSTAEDEASDRSGRLGLMGYEDTQHFDEVLGRAKRLLDQRDQVAHSMWLTVADDGTHHGVRMRANPEQHEWTIEGLRDLRQQILNVTHDLFVASWNATASDSGMQRIDRRGDTDVIG